MNRFFSDYGRFSRFLKPGLRLSVNNRFRGLRSATTLLLALLLLPAAEGASVVAGDNDLDLVFSEYTLRQGGQIVYDSVRTRLVRFGGTGYREGFPLTSEWDGSNWIPVECENQPPVQEGFAMAFDAERAQVVLFGGNPENAETWLYDGSDWTKASPAASPDARFEHAMVYDSARKRVVMFGGQDKADNPFGDTWEWDGTAWTETTPASSPEARFEHQMAYDANRSVTVLFRGKKLFTNAFGWTVTLTLLEMWEYNGSTWTEVTPGTMPTNSQTGPFVYNPLLSQVEFLTGFGGGSFDLWSYTGGNWSTASVSSGYKPSGDQMAYRGSTGEALILYNREVYQWNGTQLSILTPLFNNSRSTWADVNGDGYMDRLINGSIVRASDGNKKLGKALYLNSAQGLSMTPAWTLLDSIQMNAIAVGDLTGDGLPDAAFGSDGSEKIEVYANTGGNFGSSPVWQSDNDYAVNEVLLADVDGDGDLDLTAIIAKFDGELLVFLNDEGTLPSAPSLRFLLPAAADAEAGFIDHNVFNGSFSWADVDYDGKLECAIGFGYVYGGGDFVILLDLEDDLSALTQTTLLTGITAPLSLVDVNGDAYPDLIGTRPGEGISLHLNIDGGIQSTAFWSAHPYGDDPIDIDVADFDQDGDVDIVLGHGGDGIYGVGQTVYRNDAGSYSDTPNWRSKLYASTSYRGPVEWVDYDKDGIKDIAIDDGIFLMSSPLRDHMPPLPPRYAMAEVAAAGSTEVTISWEASPDVDIAAYEISRGWNDVNQYLITTVAVPATSFTYSHPDGGIWEYYVRPIDEAGNAGYWSKAEKIGIPYASRVAGDASPDYSVSGKLLTGDINGDGRTDLFTRNSHITEIWTDSSWHITSVSASGVFTQEWSKQWDSEVFEPGTPVLLEDATGDGRADLTVLRSREVDIGDGNLEIRYVLEVYRALAGGDGYQFAETATATVILPAGVFYFIDGSWGDANGDSIPDLAIAAYGANRQAALFLGAGTGTRSTPSWTSTAHHIEAVAFGNLNNDGRDDLFIAEDVNNGANNTATKLYVYHGIVGTGLGASPNWQDLTPGGSGDGYPATASWADFDQNGTADVTLLSSRACYAYKNTGGTLPSSETLLVFQADNNDPAQDLIDWANIDGSGALDLYGENSVILNAGARTGILNDSNFTSDWESDTTHVYKDKVVNPPWGSLRSSFTSLVLAIDLAGDGVAEHITDNGNMIFLGASGSFPPAREEVPVELIVSPSSPVLLPEPGATLTLTVTALFEDDSTQDVTSEATYDPDRTDNGTRVIRMNGNQIVALEPTVNGTARLYVQWRNFREIVDVVVSERSQEPIALRIVPNGNTLTREGETLPLNVIVTMQGGHEIDVTPDAVLNNLHPSVIQLNGVTAIAGQNGTATLTAAYGDLNTTATLHTSVSVGITHLSIEPPVASLSEGSSRSFEILAHYGDETILPVTGFATLSSGNPGVVTVSGQTVTALSTGSAELEAVYAGHRAEATVAVDAVDVGGNLVEQIRILKVEMADPASPMLFWQHSPVIGNTRNFRVLTRTDLSTGDWTPVSGSLRADPTGFMSWEDAVSPEINNRFYVIETEARSAPAP